MESKGLFELLKIIALGCQLASVLKMLRALAKGYNPIFLNRESFLTAHHYLTATNKTNEKLPSGLSTFRCECC